MPDPASDPMVATGIIPAGTAWATFMNCANPEGITVQFTIG
ncbi:MAG TPA: hypothetical protein VM327_01990 [Candidatus Thermoplasmatota archaeon]|nr:hypothetical protein [Candidatus Thermoplasmatota archaeon]